MRKAFLLSLAATAVAFASALACRDRASDHERESLVVQFGWLFDAHHLGFLWAADEGYYASCGSEVMLRPGGLDTSAAKAVLTGAAHLGQFSGPEQLLTARSEGLPLVAIAGFHRRSPHALVSLQRRPIRRPEDLRGTTVAVAFGDAAELQFRALLKRHGIPGESLRLVPFRFDLTPLLRGEVDAITGFATDQPVTLQEQGAEPIVLPYHEAGASGYGYMFFTTESLAKGRSAEIRCFLEASRRGWREVFERPEDAVRYLCEERQPDLSCNGEAEKLRLLRKIMLDERGVLATWSLDTAGIKEAQENLLEFGQLKSPVALKASIDNSLIFGAEEPAAEASP